MKTFCIGVVLLISTNARAQPPVTQKNKDSISYILTPQFWTSGFFPYSGYLFNRNKVADINLEIEHPIASLFIFKSLDLEKRHSDGNYLQQGFYTNIRVQKLTFTPYFGYLFQQNSGFNDAGSGFWISVKLTWDVSAKLVYKNTALLTNLFQNTMRNLVSRSEIELLFKRFKSTVFFWYNTSVFDSLATTTTAIAFTINQIQISSLLGFKCSLLYHTYLGRRRHKDGLSNGIVLAMAFPVKMK